MAKRSIFFRHRQIMLLAAGLENREQKVLILLFHWKQPSLNPGTAQTRLPWLHQLLLIHPKALLFQLYKVQIHFFNF